MTRSSSAMSIPQELTDLIIDHLNDSFELVSNQERDKNLLSCCLTSRAFRAQARLHLFENITVSLRPHRALQLDKLQALFQETTDLPLFVRKLRIELGIDSYGDAFPETSSFDDGKIPVILSMLSNLTHISLVSTHAGCGWPEISYDTKVALWKLRDTPNVVSLGIEGKSLLIPASFIFRWTTLKKLTNKRSSIQYVLSPTDGPPSDLFMRGKASLEELDFAESMYYRGSRHFDAEEQWEVFRHLKQLRMKIKKSKDYAALGLLLQEVQGCLQHFTLINFLSGQCFQELPDSYNANTFLFLNLRSLEIVEPALLYRSDVPNLVAELTRVFMSCASLERARLSINWIMDLTVSDIGVACEVKLVEKDIWKGLDTACHSSAGLRQLDVDVVLKYSSQEIYEDRKETFRLARERWNSSIAFPLFSSSRQSGRNINLTLEAAFGCE